MKGRGAAMRTRRDFLAADGVLLVVRDPPPPAPPARGQPPATPANPAEGDEILLAVWDDASVTALHGHVDLGTGIATALAQFVAEELDVPMGCVQVLLGDTARAPNQGPTIASTSIQIHAAPLRLAAAHARAFLLERAAQALDIPTGFAADTLHVRDGVVHAADGRRIAYAELLRGRRRHLRLDPGARVKPQADHRVVGTSVPRTDIPAKAFGELVFVHDMRLPGMLHGRVVRPPYAGADHGEFIGNTLERVDEASIAHLPGIRAVVVIRDFVGVVAEREEVAEAAAAQLRVRWKPWPGMPPLDDLGAALRANPSTPRRLVDEGDVDAALAQSDPQRRSYTWPYQMHASLGPSCALAHWHGTGAAGPALTVWAGTQNPHALRADLARLACVADVAVEVIRLEAAGCYGRNGADDVAADAALLSKAVGAPVRVQLSRAQEMQWEPKGAAQFMTVAGSLADDGALAAWDFATSYPSNGAPTLALLLTRTIEPVARAFEMGDRSARPPYRVPNLRVTVHDMAPILRASWLRGVSALPNSFAHESYVDEMAVEAGADPLAYRLRHLDDPRAAELLRATANRAGWRPHTVPMQQAASGDWLHGQGVAYARYVHSQWPGFGAAWSAWVADVDVHRTSGEVHVRRVVVGHDAGLVVNPAGLQHQVHGNVIQTTSRALRERVEVDAAHGGTVANREWGSYPILSFREVPVIEVVSMPRPGEPPLGAGESSSVPGTAAIANAIFDATGVRFRAPPFTPEVVRAGLHAPGSASFATVAATGAATAPNAPPVPAVHAVRAVQAIWPKRRGALARTAALVAGTVGLFAALLVGRAAIAPVAAVGASIYTPETLARGQRLAALGDCAGCHTGPDGVRNAGGLPIETKFGTVVSTNLTPDVATGIGAWSFSAFQRAMREGISRDGHRLYPAFPYPAFTRMTDADLTDLYAFLMAQPAVRSTPAPSTLAFPFNLRPLMALWNGLFLVPGPLVPGTLAPGAVAAAEPARSTQWQRGEYLVNGVGHCGECHTSRNALGAPRTGDAAFLAGATVDGWEAPALTAASRAPVAWTKSAFFDYLRHGASAQHGAAMGPMATVVRELGPASDADLRAMAVYLASFNPPQDDAQAQAAAQRMVAAAQSAAPLPDAAQRLFQTACGACHHDGDGPRGLGANVPLALASKLHAQQPDNLLRVILDGVREPATREIGFMPGFRGELAPERIGALAAYLRRRYAPGQPAWADLDAAVARLLAPPGR